MEAIEAAGRVYLPLGSSIAPPGVVVEITGAPQVCMGPPFYLGIRHAYSFDVRSIHFANETPAVSWGDMPAEFLVSDPRQKWPNGLVPLVGRELTPGDQVRLCVVNIAGHAQRLQVTLWGSPVPWKVGPVPWDPFEPVAELEQSEAEQARRTAKRRAHEKHAARCAADRARTAAALEPYEDGDSWESPTWEE